MRTSFQEVDEYINKLYSNISLSEGENEKLDKKIAEFLDEQRE